MGESGHYLSDSGALAFLTKHSFDFNELIYAGLPPSGVPRPQEIIEELKILVDKLAELSITACEKDNGECLTFKLSLNQRGCLDFVLDLFKDSLPKLDFHLTEEDSNITVTAKRNTTITTIEAKAIVTTIYQNEVVKGRLYSVVDLRQITDLIGKSKMPLVLHNGFNDLLHVNFFH